MVLRLQKYIRTLWCPNIRLDTVNISVKEMNILK